MIGAGIIGTRMVGEAATNQSAPQSTSLDRASGATTARPAARTAGGVARSLLRSAMVYAARDFSRTAGATTRPLARSLVIVSPKSVTAAAGSGAMAILSRATAAREVRPIGVQGDPGVSSRTFDRTTPDWNPNRFTRHVSGRSRQLDRIGAPADSPGGFLLGLSSLGSSSLGGTNPSVQFFTARGLGSVSAPIAVHLARTSRQAIARIISGSGGTHAVAVSVVDVHWFARTATVARGTTTRGLAVPALTFAPTGLDARTGNVGALGRAQVVVTVRIVRHSAPLVWLEPPLVAVSARRRPSSVTLT